MRKHLLSKILFEHLGTYQTPILHIEELETSLDPLQCYMLHLLIWNTEIHVYKILTEGC